MGSVIQTGKEYIKLLTPPLFLNVYRAFKNDSNSGLAQDHNLSNKPNLPQLDLAEIFPGIEQITVSLPVTQIERQSGMLPLRELLTLSAICQYIKPQRVFEIGTFKGASTLMIAMSTPPETKISTLDLPEPSEATKYPLDIGDITGKHYQIGEFYKASEFSMKVEQLYGDSGLFDFQPFYNTEDLIFIDGSHSYENVKADTENAYKMLRSGGVILWDDYHPEWGPGVIRALQEIKDKSLFQIKGTRFVVYKDNGLS